MLYNEILICCTIICITLNAAFSLKHHQFTDVKNCDVCKGNECRLCVYSPNSPKVGYNTSTFTHLQQSNVAYC